MSGLEVISEMPLSGFAVLTQAKRPALKKHDCRAGPATCCETATRLDSIRNQRFTREKFGHVTSGSSPEGSAVGNDGGRMEPADQSCRVLPPDRALWMGRSGRYPHLRAGAGT